MTEKLAEMMNDITDMPNDRSCKYLSIQVHCPDSRKRERYKKAFYPFRKHIRTPMTIS